MTTNPFEIIKAEEFNHGLDQLANLMHFGVGLADRLLSSSNVFVDGSRGSGKSMYLRLLSLQAKTIYERLSEQGTVQPLPPHKPFLGVYLKLAPTLFGIHEYEHLPAFQNAFQELFNVYAMECIVQTLLESRDRGLCQVDNEDGLSQELSVVALCSGFCLRELWQALRRERRNLRHRLNSPPYNPGERAQPEVLWEFAEILVARPPFYMQRVHLLIDEYDNLSAYQQRILNTYLRKRDFPLTFKIACRKHRLVTHDIHDRPLNQSGDFTRVQLDDEGLGLGDSFASYMEAIANKRLKNVGLDETIRDFLGRKRPRKTRSKGQPRQYGGFEQLVALSSGIVRTFLELCRDVYSEASSPAVWPVQMSVQDRIVRAYAAERWNSLSTDRSARPELQRLVEQVAQLFKQKSSSGAERQIIRLEIVDFDQATTFLRELLDTALDYEAFIKPNQERLQKNSVIPSTGYLLHRLLCVHFRLEPESRWDFEISSANLERLITQSQASTKDILRQPTKRRLRREPAVSIPLFPPHCPILDTQCDVRQPEPGMGFLSCRLPDAAPIRDAIQLIKCAFESADSRAGYRILTAEDYPPSGDLSCKVCAAVARSAFVLVELSGFSASVAMELGFCVARGIPTYLLFNREEQREVDEPFSSIEYFPYSVTPRSIDDLVKRQIVPFLKDARGRRTIMLGPSPDEVVETDSDVFVALPDEPYYQETLLPALEALLEGEGLSVKTGWQGRALQDLQRAVTAIAQAKYCLVDTSLRNPVRAMYLGMALGYGKAFSNLVNRMEDKDATIFANARSKSVIEYRDKSELVDGVAEFLKRMRGDR